MVVARLSRSRRLFAGVTLAYLLVVAFAQGLHHDFQCHVRHPGHCEACRATAAAPHATSASHALVPRPLCSGSVAPQAERACQAPGLRAESGRAPPDSV